MRVKMGTVMPKMGTFVPSSEELKVIGNSMALDTATHFAFRDECMACPVVQLCKGSCMFLEGEFFKQSCANEFAFNFGVMMAAVWHLTGMVVVGAKHTGRAGTPKAQSVSTA